MAKRGENIYKRKDGRWEARVIKDYDEHGRAVYAYFYGRSYKEVKEKIHLPLPSLQKQSNSTGETSKDSPRFESILDEWLENRRERLKKSSYVKYFNIVNKHIKPSLGHYAIMDISNTILNSFAFGKIKAGTHDEADGLSEKTIKDIMTVIKSVLRYAVTSQEK